MTMEYRSCPICYADFIPKNTKHVYCEECKLYRNAEIRAYRESKRPIIVDRLSKVRSVDDIVRDLEAYNKKHGTWLTYGQYVMKLENGWLKE